MKGERKGGTANWILDAVSKKPSKGSGKDRFPLRVAEELVAVVEGRSAVWERRQGLHRLGTTARVNLSFGRAARRR